MFSYWIFFCFFISVPYYLRLSWLHISTEASWCFAKPVNFNESYRRNAVTLCVGFIQHFCINIKCRLYVFPSLCQILMMRSRIQSRHFSFFFIKVVVCIGISGGMFNHKCTVIDGQHISRASCNSTYSKFALCHLVSAWLLEAWYVSPSYCNTCDPFNQLYNDTCMTVSLSTNDACAFLDHQVSGNRNTFA